MRFRPLNDNLVVKRLEAPSQLPSGLYVPDNAKEKPKEGEVLAVGPGAKRENGTLQPVDVKVGDLVLFSAYAGTEMKVDDEEYLLLKEVDILAVREK